MTLNLLQRQFIIATLFSIGFSTPAWADSTEDALGQFLDQNFPTIYSGDDASDPIRNFANRPAPATNGNLQTATPISATTNYDNLQQANGQQYDFINRNGGVSQPSITASSPTAYGYAPLLNARSALVMNANTGKILYQKNMDSVRPIASISKLVSAMVLLDAKLNMYEDITITEAEIDRLKGTSSRLSIGTTLTRGELLHLGLMSSENRAIHALARTYPGGMSAFVAAMNAKAQSLGMTKSRFYEPTGLDPRNVSTARDLSVLVRAANKYPQIRNLTTSNYGQVYTSAGRTQTYKNTNALVREGVWNISLQKTGYIKEAGRSMVLQAQMGNEPVVIVVLGSSTSSSRVNDARVLSTMVNQTPL